MSSTLKFAANLNFLFTEGNTSIAERLKLAHQNGFRSAEVPYPEGEVNEVVQQKIATGIEIALVNLAFDKSSDKLKFGSTSVPGAESLFKQQLQNTIDFAKAVNCKKIHITAGVVREEPCDKHLQTYVANLKIAASALQKENLIGVIEPINKYAIPGYFMNSYETAQHVLTTLNCDNIKLMVDIYHLQHIGGNVTYTLKEYKNFIGHVQIAQVPSRNEPDTPGELDFSYIFAKIAESGYDDWIGCEYKPKTNTVEGLKWVEKYGLQF